VGSSAAALATCIPFSVFCAGPPTVIPNLFFEVEGGGSTASCDAYTVTLQLCAAGSTCDNCKTL